MTDEPRGEEAIEDLDATEQETEDVRGGFRPSPTGDGTTQHFLKAPINGVVQKVRND